ncbi:MAG: uroporphyrinogen decarboxylase family protein [Promethearchaeota archaeon]
MNPKERILSVFTGDRNKLDRVPTHVQGLLNGFVQKNEEALFNDYDGEMTYNAKFDGPLVLGFDSVFAGLSGCVSCRPIKIVDDDGVENVVGMSGQANRHDTNYYQGGLVKDLETHERLWEGIEITDNRDALLKIQEFHESITGLIFPLTMVGGVFDTTWQSMGFTTFARNHRKNTNFYRRVIKDYMFVTRANIERIIDVLGDRPGIINILDDVAFKGRLMISPERWWQDLGTQYKEITGMIHDAGMHAIMHTDGDVTELVPYLVRAGFEGVQGWEGGADPFTIVERFPDFVTLGWGDVGDVLPFGSKDDIEEHVKYIMDAAKENRHLVAGPSTVLFDKIPYENARYFMECIKKHGAY